MLRAAGLSNWAARRWSMALPAVAALIYPVLLAGVYRSAHLLSAVTDSAAVLGGVALVVSLVITFAVPMLALAVASGLGLPNDRRMERRAPAPSLISPLPVRPCSLFLASWCISPGFPRVIR